MFGISFSELLLVGLVALLVLGPERLPGAARTAGLWIGRLKRSFNAIKQEVEREIGADEIRRQLHNEHILSLEEEARKIMQPQQPPAAPVTPAPAEPATETPVSPAPVSTAPVMGAASPVQSADIGPAAPAESASVAPPPVHVGPAAPAAPESAPALAPVITPATAVQRAPSANDSSLPPRAP
ncbi:Sec-independent protein translocase protein TatB [Pseudomonas petrae]|uniref:Sec-independent protein translocase protein TatB n=1 Tax=Pseudomonas petrae TaxID=2912190 RepID=A0ABS9I9T3_9PSED|nr:Sec-independent protein translocase protein TatB [Pseudomonas petrae]MCF7531291.1 Sec-independent protein translocase protein TatB [Pseudomonas petrae]MCF7536850.1 Sec-independent protein translocase protein TatB [Pseudomonas petrae]MCF7543786.1 Sec-independent protein translocase protein TatB [Pseudomonas petrae]MCF7557629.1 Sec-independent protein translocase protein TatB [Pseudomonas petrae]